jgi:3-oxo-5-alpha-steroid 4-dehydrogenase 1
MQLPTITGNKPYDLIAWIGFALVLSTVLGAFVMKTPYGRFGHVNWGIKLNPRWGWFLMELPAWSLFIPIFFLGSNAFNLVPSIFFGIWMIHYTNRGILFPMLMRVHPGAKKTFNIIVVSIGMVVTCLHAYLNGRFFSEVGDFYTPDWLTDPRFIIGILIYYTGFVLNLQSDHILRNLRSKDPTATREERYKIPRGGLFKFVSCPQYLTELIAWTGFALMTWSPGGLFILGISAANLIPRAIETHRWYKGHFEDYPKERKALFPFLL